ncbi:MAG: S-layer homology domain-containing protein, partial [Bryobacterales bacterium]|nr:S-layer homology domain-containing protein [Bryobacterales bacterium]
SNAITSGCSGTNYCPSDVTTRGQMAVFLIRSMVLTDDFDFPSAPFFEDVPATHPQFKWIQKLRSLGITTGCTTLRYCPNDPVTRGQMAVFLVRSRFGETFTSPSTPYFTDVPANQTFFRYIQKLRQLGVTTGCTATTYCTNDPTTRGQMAVFLTRAYLTPW